MINMLKLKGQITNDEEDWLERKKAEKKVLERGKVYAYENNLSHHFS